MHRLFLPIFALCFVSACVARPQLMPKPATVPADIDLTGFWTLESDERDGRSEALVAVFIEHGQRLKVTQTDFALFISFDRSIVEEYRFGELRQINVGPVAAQRASGWEGGGYVIETLDADAMVLAERYRLSADGERLLRDLDIRRNERQFLSIRQVFQRDAGGR